MCRCSFCSSLRHLPGSTFAALAALATCLRARAAPLCCVLAGDVPCWGRGALKPARSGGQAPSLWSDDDAVSPRWPSCGFGCQPLVVLTSCFSWDGPLVFFGFGGRVSNTISRHIWAATHPTGSGLGASEKRPMSLFLLPPLFVFLFFLFPLPHAFFCDCPSGETR